MVYSPDKGTMYCPYCEGTDCEEISPSESLTVCASCGGELSIDATTSASQCPYCSNHIIFDERVSGKYKPDSVIPFKVSKKMAVEAMDKEFKKRVFAPLSFLSEKTLEGMKGIYVPFFLYDFKVESNYRATGTKVRSWRSGDYRYTETSYYSIVRRMYAEYDNIPADASYQMDDATMDLMEPFDYTNLSEFDPKYLSGFFGEIYNAESDEFIERARTKAKKSAKELLFDTIKGYNTISTELDVTRVEDGQIDYTLFPVWRYTYMYRKNPYYFYVNGQNGKVIGKLPISKGKVVVYGLFASGMLLTALEMILKIVGVLF